MSNELKIYIDGKFLPKSEAKISVTDHGLLYGDGIFEGIRAYNGRVFKLVEHINRLYDSAKMINLNIGIEKEKMINNVLETLRINNLNEAYIRLVVTRGDGTLGLDPASCPKSTIIIIAQPMSPIADPKGIRCITSSMRRISPSVFSPNIKSLNYLNNVLAKMEATQRGCTEAIFLDINGNVCEGSAENIFMIKNGILITPPYIHSLRGITRDTILEISRDSSNFIDVQERDVSIFEFYAADEVFMTGTAAELAPVVEIDGRKIGDGKPGELTLLLQEEFKRLVNNSGTKIENKKYEIYIGC